MTPRTIEHEGVVERVENGLVFVCIQNLSACASCHAKGACTASDMADKIIEVQAPDFPVKPGDNVLLVGQKSLGLKAVFLAYFLPFLLVLLTLVVTSTLVESEITAGLAALGILIPYYGILALFKQHLKQSFAFTIQKILSE